MSWAICQACQTEHPPAARKKVLAAAERHGIDVDADSNVRERAT